MQATSLKSFVQLNRTYSHRFGATARVLKSKASRRTDTPSFTKIAFLSSTQAAADSFESPSHPGLFYHALPSPPFPQDQYSVSFLSKAPPDPRLSPTTIGYVQVDDEAAKTGPLNPKTFAENPDFRILLHEILPNALRGNQYLETLAKVRQEGYIHIGDARNPVEANRVPDPSDIVASLFIKAGEVDYDSYEPGAMHRLVTLDGMMKLEDSLQKKLVEGLNTVRQIELQQASSEDNDV